MWLTLDVVYFVDQYALCLADDGAQVVHFGLLPHVQVGLLPDLVGHVCVERGALTNPTKLPAVRPATGRRCVV